jgi:hypothetical protein
MFTRDEFRQVKRLQCFVQEKSQHYQWLYIPVVVDELTLNTLCLALSADLEDFEEYAEQLMNNGFHEFLSSAQLEEIAGNLQLQKLNYTDAEILAAIRFYWENDAFIDLEKIM